MKEVRYFARDGRPKTIKIVEEIAMKEGNTPTERLLIKHEGWKNYAYLDSVNIITIGVGRNLEDKGLSSDEIMILLRNDIDNVRVNCNDSFDWFAELDLDRRCVIVNMVFNLGLHGFKKFKKTIKFIEDCDYLMASIEMLNSKWAEQVGVRASELSQVMAGTMTVDKLIDNV